MSTHLTFCPSGESFPPSEIAGSVFVLPSRTAVVPGPVSISSGATKRLSPGKSVALSIPLDSCRQPAATDQAILSSHPKTEKRSQVHTASGKRTLIRRDSLERREALLKGNEGSRQRRRWENDRLLNNPWFTPPLPSDWEIRPTHPRRSVPYYLASLWDAAEFQRSVEERLNGKSKGKGRPRVSPAEEAASNVPKEVRAVLKRQRATKGLLHDLEEEVRLFLQEWSKKEEQLRKDGLHDIDSEEEEIVFVGRNGATPYSSERMEKNLDEVGDEKMLYDGLLDDRGASFGRWLVHSIATYYGLQTWSVTTGDPARREAYVGMGNRRPTVAIKSKVDLPRPLWGMV